MLFIIFQDFVLRNRSQNRLRLQVTVVSSTDFKILKGRSDTEVLNNMKIVLHPLESRAISIAYMPATVGASAGTLKFTPLDPVLQQSKNQQINLYGYGGYACIEVIKLSKDTAGKFWLSMGDPESKRTVTRYFFVKNTGNISGFVHIVFESKSMCSFSAITITPNRFVLAPHEGQKITIEYTATKEDLHFFRTVTTSDVEIGNITLSTGAEALRGRIRRLTRKATGDNLEVRAIVQELSKSFENEEIPSDVSKIKETITCMKELLQQLVIKEIGITCEHDLDRTIVDENYTSQFQTLCRDISDFTSIAQDNKINLNVEPCAVLLTPPQKTVDRLLLTCDNTESVCFKVSVIPSAELKIVPNTGIISPGQTVILKMSCDEMAGKDVQIFKVVIYGDRDIVEVSVKVMRINSPSSRV